MTGAGITRRAPASVVGAGGGHVSSQPYPAGRPTELELGRPRIAVATKSNCGMTVAPRERDGHPRGRWHGVLRLLNALAATFDANPNRYTSGMSES
jgi:hypothetical protein